MATERRVGIALGLDVTEPSHQEVFAGVLQYALEHRHWRCEIDEHPGYAQPRTGKEYDGVIARATRPLQKRLKQRGIPLVNTLYRGQGPGVASVITDTAWCGRAAADLLLDRGHTQFLCFGRRTYPQGEQIIQAFAAHVTEAGHACHFELTDMANCSDRSSWHRLGQQLHARLDRLVPPIGVLVSSPWMARLLIQMCHGRGWYVPHEIAVICIDGTAAALDVPPSLSCVGINYARIGYEAAALLERLMNGEPVPEQPILVPPKGIVRRLSTGDFAVRDEVVAEALHYVNNNLGKHLTVEVIANAINTSPRSLQRRFEKELGRAVGVEVRRLRVAAAKRMLGIRSLSVGTIAKRCGFKSFVTLNSAFRHEMKMTPTAFREKLFGPRHPAPPLPPSA